MVNSLTMFETLPEWAIGHERFLDDAVRIWNSVSKAYPPHNLIKKSSDEYVITMAVAGFSKEDLSVKSEDGTLTIEVRSLLRKQNKIMFTRVLLIEILRKSFYWQRMSLLKMLVLNMVCWRYHLRELFLKMKRKLSTI